MRLTQVDERDLRFGPTSVYFPGSEVLTLSDLHLGLEESARKGGMSLPLGESEEIENRLRDALTRFGPSTVVFNGDIHHSFGELGDTERTIRRVDRVVDSSDAEAVYVEGNHDTMLSSVVDTVDRHEEDGVVFVHGDEMPPDLPDADLYVVGHDHPTVEIEMEKRSCFLHGPFEDSEVLMTPAFNPLCEGVVINRMSARDFMSPFVRGDFGEFRVIVENDGEILRFPPLDEFREML